MKIEKRVAVGLSFLMLFNFTQLFSQSIPSKNENIPFLVTFGNKADKNWGDDDFNQIVFFSVPEEHKTSFYIRIFDPEIGGKYDEYKQNFNTTTKFSLYGAGCFSAIEEENKDPIGNYKKGNLIHSESFGSKNTYDDKWFTFGPINPLEGEFLPEFGGHIFKLVVNGTAGDDGNLYRLFMSTKIDDNIPVEGGNAFMYEYSFRLNTEKQTSHIYPYVDQYTVAVKQHNFDFDNDAYIKLISMSQPGIRVKTSNDGTWESSLHQMKEVDKKTSLDIQIVKIGKQSNNNVVFYITNQRDKFMQFYSIPLGIIPKKTIGIRPVKK